MIYRILDVYDNEKGKYTCSWDSRSSDQQWLLNLYNGTTDWKELGMSAAVNISPHVQQLPAVRDSDLPEVATCLHSGKDICP